MHYLSCCEYVRKNIECGLCFAYSCNLWWDGHQKPFQRGFQRSLCHWEASPLWMLQKQLLCLNLSPQSCKLLGTNICWSWRLSQMKLEWTYMPHTDWTTQMHKSDSYNSWFCCGNNLSNLFQKSGPLQLNK